MFDIQVADGGQVKISGRLDAAQADRARDALGRLPGPVVIDCSELEYISSAGLGVLVQTFKRLNDTGSGLRLVRLTPRVRNVFTLSGLDRIIPVE
jgi:anti-sigma B factor antagonist